MSGDVHVQFCEQRWGKFLALTHLVFVFKRPRDAEVFYRVLPKRLAKYGLQLHEEKSQIIPSGHIAAERANKTGEEN